MLENLNTLILGKNVIYYKTIDSTQKEVYRRIENNTIKNGTVVIADIQTMGVGTHGRIWHTDEENNIAFTFVLTPNCTIDKLEGITLDIASILVNIFKSLYNINLTIKYPNDLMVNTKKIGGILTQTKLVKNQVKYLVVGIGINTSQITFAKDIKDIASSIKKEFNVEVNKDLVISNFLEEFEKNIIERLNN